MKILKYAAKQAIRQKEQAMNPFSRFVRSASQSSRKQPKRLTIECLEPRAMMSASPGPIYGLTGSSYSASTHTYVSSLPGGGTLSSSATTAGLLGVEAFAVRQDGNIYVELGNNDLRMYTPQLKSFADFGTVSAFAMRQDGYAYIEQASNHYLYLNTPSANYALGTVQGFGLRNDGNGYVWLTNGSLYLNSPAANYSLGTAKGFAVRNDGNGYVWLTSGDLFLNADTKNYDFGVVKSFAMRSDGNAYVLTTSDVLYLNTPVQNDNFTTCYGPVQQIKTDSSGNGYFLTTDGILYENTLTSNTIVNLNVSAFSFNSSGQLTVTNIARPAASTPYAPVGGMLFGPNGPSYLDVRQGGLGDCWLIAGLAEIADRDPADIKNMFTYDGTMLDNGSNVGVYTVRLYNNSGVANYFSVDTELPTGGLGDQPVNGVLWVALVEKAYAEASSAGVVNISGVGSDSYSVLSSGYSNWAFQAVTGKQYGISSANPASIVAAWEAGELVALGSSPNANDNLIVGDSTGTHAYAVIGYNPSSATPFELFNPWNNSSGLGSLTTFEGHPVYGSSFLANAALISQDFSVQLLGAGAADATKISHGAVSVLNAHPPAGAATATSDDQVEATGQSKAMTIAAARPQFAVLADTLFAQWGDDSDIAGRKEWLLNFGTI